MKATLDKCHLVIYDKYEKILGIKIDHKLNFNSQIDEICIKSGQKLNTLLRLTTYNDFSKQRMQFNAFFLSQSRYYPLVSMYNSHIKTMRHIVSMSVSCHLYTMRKNLHFIKCWRPDGYVSMH